MKIVYQIIKLINKQFNSESNNLLKNALILLKVFFIQSIEVFNALGQNVMTLNGQNAYHLTLNLDGNSQGIYLLKVFTQNRVETIKVSYSK